MSYGILQQEPGLDVRPFAAAKGMGIIIKQPLANAIPELRQRPRHPNWSWKWDLAQRLDWAPAGSGLERLGLAMR